MTCTAQRHIVLMHADLVSIIGLATLIDRCGATDTPEQRRETAELMLRLIDIFARSALQETGGTLPVRLQAKRAGEAR